MESKSTIAEGSQGRAFPFTLKDALLCLAYANLCFLNAWRDIQVFLDPSQFYYRKSEPNPLVFVALILNILALSGAALAVLWMVRRSSSPRLHRYAGAGLLLAMLLPLNEIRIFILQEFDLGHLGQGFVPPLMLPDGLLLAFAFGAWRYGDRRMLAPVRAVLLILSPLFFIAAGSYLVRMPPLTRAEAAVSARSAGARTAPVRVVWVVFDEWDANLSLSPSGKHPPMPELARVLETSLSAPDAVPPSRHTAESIPGLLTGHPVAQTAPIGSNDLGIRFGGETQLRPLSQTKNIFSQVSKRGWASGVSGWYHPYCRIFGKELASCYYEPSSSAFQKAAYLEQAAGYSGVTGAMAAHWEDRIYRLPWLRFYGLPDPLEKLNGDYRRVLRRRTADDLRALHREALALVARPDLSFVFLHYPIPHPPGIARPEDGEWSNEDDATYFGNLRLVDGVIGDLMNSLEDSKLDSRTAIVFTSDHPLREEVWDWSAMWTAGDRREVQRKMGKLVPFIAHFPGQTGAARFAGPFNTALLYHLSLQILDGSVSDAPGAMAWLRDNSRNLAPVTLQLEGKQAGR